VTRIRSFEMSKSGEEADMAVTGIWAERLRPVPNHAREDGARKNASPRTS
jgi:hypothetical protein